MRASRPHAHTTRDVKHLAVHFENIEFMVKMSWKYEEPEGNDGMVEQAVEELLEKFNYDSIVPQPSKGTGSSRQKHVKRPMNAFMVFAQAMRRRLSKQQPSLHNAELSKKLGEMWKDLSSGEKVPFIKMADKLRTQHKHKYPDYKYQPRRRKPQPACSVKPKQEPSPDTDPTLDFTGMPDLTPSLLSDGTPSSSEMDAYLPEPNYHQLESPSHRYAHNVPPPFYPAVPSHIPPSSCSSEWFYGHQH